jgi:tetratricopeptide (TPR) repeat protein
MRFPLRSLLVSAGIFWLAYALTPVCSFAQSSASVTIDSNETLFTVMAALNAAGYNTGLYAKADESVRQEIRSELAKKQIAVLPQIAKFYVGHRADDPGADFGQYISLALLLDSPPKFNFTIPQEDLPPDASDLRNLVPLLRAFYREANIEGLYTRFRPKYMEAIGEYSETIRRDITLADAYLRFPSGTYLGRTYHIYLCLLGVPEQVQARIYGENYYLVITPSTRPRFKEIRHQYLHFLLDPLAVKYAADIHQKASLQAVARKAPALGQDFKNDYSLLVTECLIHAVELRMDKPKDAPQQVADDLASGLILTPYFYNALQEYEKQDSPMSVYYQPMIQGINLKKMQKTLADVHFTVPKPAPKVAAAPTPSEKDHLLDQGDNFIYLGQYDQAKAAFKQVLEKYDPKSERALFGFAIAASNTQEPDIAEEYFKKTLAVAHNLRIVTWSHIYLGRIYDLEDRRDDALKQYRAASVTAATFPEALAAVQSGLRLPFGAK